MIAIPPSPALTIYAANHAFTAESDLVYVGTALLADPAIAIVHFRTTVDFGVYFRFDPQRKWVCSGTPKVRHLHLRPDVMQPQPKPLPEEAPHPLELGLHAFWYGPAEHFLVTIAKKAIEALGENLEVEYFPEAM